MYCIDANSLIEPWNALYPVDAFPSFWNKLDSLITAGNLIAPAEVVKELEDYAGGKDPLTMWVKKRPRMIQQPDAMVQTAVRAIVNSHNIVNVQKQKSNGDPWVIAHAQCYKLTVVTQEKSAPLAKYKKIPDVCAVLKVPCINILQLIRAQKWSF